MDQLRPRAAALTSTSTTSGIATTSRFPNPQPSVAPPPHAASNRPQAFVPSTTSTTSTATSAASNSRRGTGAQGTRALEANLPVFLQRRPQQALVPSKTPADSNQPGSDDSDGDTLEPPPLPLPLPQSHDDGYHTRDELESDTEEDEDEYDMAATNEESDDEGVDGNERLRLAEELSVATGMPLTEVMGLLEEEARLKRERRQLAAERKSHESRTRVKVRRPPPSTDPDAHRVQEGDSVERRAPTTTTLAPPPLPPTNHPTRTPATVAVTGVDNANPSLNHAASLQQLLSEFLPPTSSAVSTAPINGSSAVTAEALLTGEVDGLTEYRRRRQQLQHDAIVGHLARTRGLVEKPSSLVSRDAFVVAYELEVQKRRALKTLKEQYQRRLKEDEERERRMKGIFVNLAIRKKIEESQGTATAGPAAATSSRKKKMSVPSH